MDGQRRANRDCPLRVVTCLCDASKKNCVRSSKKQLEKPRLVMRGPTVSLIFFLNGVITLVKKSSIASVIIFFYKNKYLFAHSML